MSSDLPFAAVRPTSPARFFYWNRDFSWMPPALPDFDLWCIFEGRGTVALRGNTYDLHPGVCFVLRPGDCPRAKHDATDPLMAFYCHFHLLDGRGRRLSERRIELPPPGLEARDLPWFRSLARQCVSGAQREDDLGRRQCRLALEQMLAQVWEWWQSPPAQADATIQSIVEEIQRQPQKLWDVDQTAQQTHLSRAQFTRRFKRQTGKSPKAFVIETRLDVARQLILETAMPVTQIAAELGYQDIYFFSRQFKQRFGRAPSRLRSSTFDESADGENK